MYRRRFLKITEDLVDMMIGWRHSGFNVYCGPRIQPGEEEGVWEDKGGIVRDTYVSLPRHRGSNILYFSSQGVSDYFPATSRGKCLTGL